MSDGSPRFAGRTRWRLRSVRCWVYTVLVIGEPQQTPTIRPPADGATERNIMESPMFTAGALYGLTVYSEEHARVGTFDTPRLVGHVAALAEQSDWKHGMAHGLALGAQRQMDSQAAVLDWPAAGASDA